MVWCVMVLRLKFLGFELWTVTVEFEHDEEADDEPPKPSTETGKKLRRAAAWWALR